MLGKDENDLCLKCSAHKYSDVPDRSICQSVCKLTIHFVRVISSVKIFQYLIYNVLYKVKYRWLK